MHGTKWVTEPWIQHGGNFGQTEVPEWDFEGFETTTNTATVKKIVIVDIVSMGKNMGFGVDSGDIEELGEDYLLPKSLYTFKMNSKTLAKEKGKEDVPNSLINEICAKWGDMQSFVEKCHPDSSKHFQCLILEKNYNTDKNNIGQVFTERRKETPEKDLTEYRV